MRKQKPTCYRCGRQFEEGETYTLMWTGHCMAPVCHDDKCCEERVLRHIFRGATHMRKVRNNASRYHTFDGKRKGIS